jgi:hypothetical protein
MNELKDKTWVVSADMGYGHQRAVYPLKNIAEDGIITVGSSEAISKAEQKLWKKLLSGYEFFTALILIYLFAEV